MQASEEIIKICFKIDKFGVIVFFEASGHAGSIASGKNIVCGAVTILLRTTYRTFLAKNGTKAVVTAKKEGQLYFQVEEYLPENCQQLKGITDYLLTGLKDMESEYPDYIKLIKE